jgi:hypothetical protein
MHVVVFVGYGLINGTLTTTRNYLLKDINDDLRKNAKFFIPTILETISIHCYVSFFIVMAFHIKMRFEIINEILMTAFHTKCLNKRNKTEFQNILTSHSPIYVLKVLSILHIQLNDAIKLMNKIFLLPVAFFIAMNLCGSTFSLYETYDLISAAQKNLRHLGYNMAIYLLNLHYFMYTFAVIAITVSVTRNRDETYKLLKNISFEEFDDKLNEKIRIFELQIKSSRAQFSCGLFDFNWTLLYSVSIKYIFLV